MSVIFNTDKRHVIPRWRSLKIAATTGELSATNDKKRVLPYAGGAYLNEQKLAWEQNRTLPYAGDLLSSALVLGEEEHFSGVAQFIVENESNPLSPLLKLAKKVLKLNWDDNPHEDSESVENNILATMNPKQYEVEIRKLRWYLQQEPKNPLAYLELGRIYTLIGKIDKAKRNISTAVSLDSDNRFILRSASRFYHHVEKNPEKALHIIKKSEYLKYDPWLVSAEIAYSSILDRHSKFVKPGIELLKKYNDDLSSITELASAIGTWDYTHNKTKEGRKFFKQALLKPNDNSLAQVGWLVKNIDGKEINLLNYEVPLAFEAKAHGFYNHEKFKDSLDYTLRWIEDEPYSSRPYRLASSLWGIFLNNRSKGIEILRKGHMVNPKDKMIINNIAYYLALENRGKEALSLFEDNLEKLKDDFNNTDAITYTATAGLILYKNNMPSEGKELYLRSMSQARKIKNYYIEALAMVNYVKEELKYSNDKQSLMKQLESICKERTEPEVKKLYREVKNEYEKNLKIEHRGEIF